MGRTLYVDDVLVGMVDTNEIAQSIVATMNAAPDRVWLSFHDTYIRDDFGGAYASKLAALRDMAGHPFVLLDPDGTPVCR